MVTTSCECLYDQSPIRNDIRLFKRNTISNVHSKKLPNYLIICIALLPMSQRGFTFYTVLKSLCVLKNVTLFCMYIILDRGQRVKAHCLSKRRLPSQTPACHRSSARSSAIYAKQCRQIFLLDSHGLIKWI